MRGRWGATAASIGAASALVVLGGAVTGQAARAEPVPRLAGEHRLSGVGSSIATVRVPIGVTYVVASDGTTPAIAVRGGGPAVGLVLARRAAIGEPAEPVLRAVRVVACDEEACGTDPDAEKVVAEPGNGGVSGVEGTRYRLPPGVYDIVVAASDGEPVELELRFDGARGSADGVLRETRQARVAAMVAQPTAPGHVAAGTDIVAGDNTMLIGALRLTGSWSSVAGAVLEWCQYAGGAAPLGGKILPACLAQDSADDTSPRPPSTGSFDLFSPDADGRVVSPLVPEGERSLVTARLAVPSPGTRVEGWALTVDLG